MYPGTGSGQPFIKNAEKNGRLEKKKRLKQAWEESKCRDMRLVTAARNHTLSTFVSALLSHCLLVFCRCLLLLSGCISLFSALLQSFPLLFAVFRTFRCLTLPLFSFLLSTACCTPLRCPVAAAVTPFAVLLLLASCLLFLCLLLSVDFLVRSTAFCRLPLLLHLLLTSPLLLLSRLVHRPTYRLLRRT